MSERKNSNVKRERRWRAWAVVTARGGLQTSTWGRVVAHRGLRWAESDSAYVRQKGERIIRVLITALPESTRAKERSN